MSKWAMLLAPGCWLLSRTLWLIRAVIGAVIKLALLPLKCAFVFGTAFENIKGNAKQMEEMKMKMKKKQKRK